MDILNVKVEYKPLNEASIEELKERLNKHKEWIKLIENEIDKRSDKKKEEKKIKLEVTKKEEIKEVKEPKKKMVEDGTIPQMKKFLDSKKIEYKGLKLKNDFAELIRNKNLALEFRDELNK